jgi:phosphoenolpyruvate carboxykinase (ATP)
MPINVTRRLLTVGLDGALNQAEFFTDPHFGFQVPAEVAGTYGSLLKPRETWSDKKQLDVTVRRLLQLFRENFAKFENGLDEDVRKHSWISRRRVGYLSPFGASRAPHAL